MPTPSRVVSFGVFDLDLNSGELRRHGLKVRLPDQSFQILKALLARPGEVVTRDELRQVLWSSETFVDFEVGLNSAVRKLREALDDQADNPRFVETLPRRGYRFVASLSVPAVIDPSPEPVEPPAAAVPVLSAPPASPAPVRRLHLTRWRTAALALAVVAGVGAAAYGWAGWSRQPAGAEPIRGVLVLPFENLTGDPGQDYFVDSVSDALTLNLAQVDGLEVISRTTALHYRHTPKPLSEIGRELPAINAVVSGTVTRTATGVRITTQLSRTSNDRVEWAKPFEAEVSGILRLQQQIAAEIAVAAGQTAPRFSGGRTTQRIAPQAYEAYLKGLTARGELRHDGFRRAVGYFEQAIAIEPEFAEAWAELAFTQMQFLFGGPFSPHEIAPKAEAAARKALELDDTLFQAHRTIGQLLNLYYWQWEEGARALERAAELGNNREGSGAALERHGAA